MKLVRSLRKLEKELEDLTHVGSTNSRAVLRNVGLISAGVTVVAIGVVVGREIRQRYKFNRRTPYDVYSQAGEDTLHDMEFGLGV